MPVRVVPRTAVGKVFVAAAVGAMAGGLPLLLIAPTAPFATWGSMLLAGIGGIAVGMGTGVGVFMHHMRSLGLRVPALMSVLAATALAGFAGYWLLSNTASTIPVIGAAVAGLLSGLLTWRFSRTEASAMSDGTGSPLKARPATEG